MPRPTTGSVVVRKWKDGRTTTFGIRWQVDGVRYSEATTATTRREADRLLRQRIADVERGAWTPPAAAQARADAAGSFHELATRWFERRSVEASERTGRPPSPRTTEHWLWCLSGHLLPALADVPVASFTARTVREYVAAKRAEAAAGRGLSTGAIRSTVLVLAMVLDDAVEADVLPMNPARGAVKLRASKPRRSWLTAAEVNALLDAAGPHAPLLATMALAGLQVSEACALRWRNVDLARGTLTVESGKTDAAARTIEVWPDLRTLLIRHRADHPDATGDEHVFLSKAGTPRTRHGVRRRVLQPVIERANVGLVKAGRAPIIATCHSLRRTFASLMYAGGATPAEVQQAMGHTSPALALSMYVTVMSRNADTGDRVAALLAAEREPVAA